MIVNLLTFDVEEYFHGPAFSHIPDYEWKNQQSRIVRNVEKLLLILDGQRATFFVLGWVAKEHPNLLREIYNQGHEIACHSDMHRNIWELSPTEFRDDLIRAKEKIEDVIGVGIVGFRAPTFSIIKETLWAFNIIHELGFKYDSSVFPIHHDKYGIPDFPRKPFKLFEDFWEIPLSTMRFAGINVPFGGGGYLRIYPYWLTKLFIRKINGRKTPYVFYQHPWEIDDIEITKIKKPKSMLYLLRRKIALGKAEIKLRKVIKQFKFAPIREWLEEVDEKERR